MSRFLILVLFLFACPCALAQTATVTGTVTDSSLQAWNYGNYTFTFVPSTVNPAGPYTFNGSPFNPGMTIPGSLSSTATFSASVPENTAILPSGSQWKLQVCPDATPTPCYSANFIISSSGAITITPPPIVVNLTPTPSFARAYADSEIINAPHGAQYFNITLNTYRMCTAPFCTWVSVGGGAANPAGSDTQLQINNHGSFGALSGLTVDSSTSPTQLNVGLDMNVKGPNPYIDIRWYGARGVGVGGIASTCTISASSNSATFGSASNFLVGDGVTCYGAGANLTLSTPSAPTVTPGIIESPSLYSPTANIAAASSTYSYAIRALDKFGGFTAASPTTTITNGPASLGAYSTNAVTSESRANDVVSVVLSSAPAVPIVAGSLVHDSGSSDATFSGWYNVTAVTDSTHFSMASTGLDTRAGATASATGGNVAFFVANKITWSPVTGAWNYAVYVQRPGDSAQHPVNVTLPTSFDGTTLTQYNDYGTMEDATSVLPDYIPSTATAGASNDNLTTTITGISGNTVTLAANAGNSVSGAVVKKDDGPALAAARLASLSAFGSCVYIPIPGPSQWFIVNSFTNLGQAHICQEGPLELNATVQIQGNSIWSGVGAGSSSNQFSFGSYPVTLIETATPGVYVTGGEDHFDHLAFEGSANGNILMFMENASNSTGDYLDFATAGGSADLTSMGLVMREGFVLHFQHTLWSAGGPNSGDASWFPELYMPPGNVNTSANSWVINNSYFNKRGIVQEGGATFTIGNEVYAQALMEPMLTETSVGGGSSITGTFSHVTNDTSASPYFTAANTGVPMVGTLGIDSASTLSNEVGGQPGPVSGTRIPSLRVTGGFISPGAVGQDRAMWNSAACNVNLPTFGFGSDQCLYLNDNILVQSPYSMNWTLPAPSGLAVNFTSGGSVGTGVHKYAVTAVGFNGGESAISVPVSVTVSSGSQTLNASWNAVTAAASYTLYDTGLGTQVTGCVAITTLSCSVASYGCCSVNVPTSASTGSTSIDSTQVITPRIAATGQVNSAISLYPGSDFCTQLKNALAGASVGQIFDSRNISSNQTCSTNPFGGTPVSAITVILPAVKITSTGVTWNLAGWSGLTLQGGGSQAGGQPSTQGITELDFTNSGATDGIQIGNTNLKLKGFVVNMESTGTGNCIDVNAGMLYSSWDDVECLNSGADGVFFNAGSGATTTQNVEISRLYSHGNVGAGIHVKATVANNGNSQIDFIRSIAYNNTGDGWKAESTVSGTRNSGIQVIGGRSENNGGNGVNFVGDGFWRFFGIESEGNTGFGFTCNSSSDRIQVYGDSYSNNTAGNFNCIAAGATNITEVPDNIVTNAAVIATNFIPSGYTVATLPSAATLGARAMVIVTDASSFTPGTCTGGGSNYMIAVSNGTIWSCH